jgi:hypothetical protein
MSMLFLRPRQTIDLMAGLFGVPKAERQTDAILEMVGLADQADMYARRLSGGMRRRLLVGKAMVHQPPIWFWTNRQPVLMWRFANGYGTISKAERGWRDGGVDNALSGRGRGAVRPDRDYQ